MDTNKMKAISDAANIEASGWKSKENRNMMMKRIAEYLNKQGPPSWTQNLPELMKSVERFEEEVFGSAKDEAEYFEKISAKMKTIKEPLQDDEFNILPSKISGSGEEKEANAEWQEQVYQKVQALKDKCFNKLNILYKGICKRLQQYESIPQQPKTTEMGKCEHHKRALEYIFVLFKVNKSHITLDFEQKLDKVEKYIHSIEQTKNASPHSKCSQVVETFEKKPTSQIMGLQSSHLEEQDFSQNNVHLQDHQVESQFSNSHPQANEMFVEQGYGNVVQQQTSGEITSPVISTFGILASPLLENCNEVKENCQDHIVISDDSSPAMQHLIKVLTSVSAKALVASSGDIGMVVDLNDDKSTLEPLNGPPIGAIGTNLEAVIVTDSQARYLTHRDFVPKERKMNRFINSMPTSDNFVQLTSAEKSFSNTLTTQENYTILEEIKEINKRLIDTEVVVDKEKIFTGVVQRDIQHGEGLIVKLFFNSVSVNINPMPNHASNKKSIIKPLWLHIPTSYPHCSAVILDEMSSEVSKDLNDLSMKAKLKLRLSLQMLSQPLSLKDIAMSWDHCAREVICEYAQLHGGGTFTSKYGGWETYLDSS